MRHLLLVEASWSFAIWDPPDFLFNYPKLQSFGDFWDGQNSIPLVFFIFFGVFRLQPPDSRRCQTLGRMFCLVWFLVYWSREDRCCWWGDWKWRSVCPYGAYRRSASITQIVAICFCSLPFNLSAVPGCSGSVIGIFLDLPFGVGLGSLLFSLVFGTFGLFSVLNSSEDEEELWLWVAT